MYPFENLSDQEALVNPSPGEESMSQNLSFPTKKKKNRTQFRPEDYHVQNASMEDIRHLNRIILSFGYSVYLSNQLSLSLQSLFFPFTLNPPMEISPPKSHGGEGLCQPRPLLNRLTDTDEQTFLTVFEGIFPVSDTGVDKFRPTPRLFSGETYNCVFHKKNTYPMLCPNCSKTTYSFTMII